MTVTTWWGLATTVVLIWAGGWFFRRWIVKGSAKKLEEFRRWANWTAIASAILLAASAIPFATIAPTKDGLKDAAVVASAIAPLALTVSVTLASIFYSVGEWYDAFQRFRLLGITDAKPDRKGRQAERNVFWQGALRSTRSRIVISGTTLGGWFINSWEDTRTNMLEILSHGASAQILLAEPGQPGFGLRVNDPGEQAEAEIAQRASERANQVYVQIARLFTNEEFSHHIAAGRLAFYVYRMTPLSVVWVDDEIYLATYLPCVSDKACPEFSINRTGQMGATITAAIEELIRNSTKIETAQAATQYAVLCQQAA